MRGSSIRRKIINARRVIVTGSLNFIRNAWLSTAATIVMTITLSSILMTIFASVASSNTLQTFTDRLDVSIFFTKDATKQQIDQVSADLRGNSELGVKEITYISREEAKAAYTELNKNDQTTLQAIAQTEDAFPASIRVKTLDTDKLQDVVTTTRQPRYRGIVETDSYKDNSRRVAVERLGSVARFLRSAGLVASVVFGAISILVIFNTIRMAIFNRKNEIEIMQLIGASKWYIRGPFLVEAGVYGLIAGVLSAAFFYILVLGQSPKLGDYLQEISPTIESFNDTWAIIIPATLLSGIMIGSFSAYLAIRKHLKIKHSK